MSDQSTVSDRIVILGSGDHGRVVYDALDRSGRSADVLCFVNFANEESGVKKGWMGIATYLSWSSFLENAGEEAHTFVVALGDNERRKRVFDMALEAGLKPTIVIHPSAVVSMESTISGGTMILANCLIGVSAKIGENCIVNSGAIVDHDCVIGNHSTIGPAANLAGNVTIEDRVMVGMGACVLDEIHVSSRSVIAAGALVRTNVPSSVMVAGVPATIKKRLDFIS